MAIAVFCRSRILQGNQTLRSSVIGLKSGPGETVVVETRQFQTSIISGLSDYASQPFTFIPIKTPGAAPSRKESSNRCAVRVLR